MISNFRSGTKNSELVLKSTTNSCRPNLSILEKFQKYLYTNICKIHPYKIFTNLQKLISNLIMNLAIYIVY